MGKMKHGQAVGKRTPEYWAYYNAKQRCTNPENPYYDDYGKRGIAFKFTSFEQFLHHIGLKPSHHVLDRINNDGHYEQGNVRWTTWKTSGINKRKITQWSPARRAAQTKVTPL